MTAERNDFIRDIIDEDLRTHRHDHVATRFPPEPNGYLHIGHAKSICLNFGIARDYGGTCNLRYDDTNPAKEDVEYVDAIERDIRWLGFDPTAVLFSADYFPRMYELAERLVREGKAYVCDLTDDQIKDYRGTLSEPGRASPWRDRALDDNLDLLRRMKAGAFPDGARTLRAKIDMASANMKMRDPLLYRIRHAHHHRTGDAWCIYPMYDYAHPLEDAIEGITHSICTLEFENNRELYDWVLDNTGPWSPRPHQYEFARLALDYTVMSKRKLLALVQGNHVRGWDDPRMPTIAALRRRGYSPEAIRAFCDMVGVAKHNSNVDFEKLEHCVRDDLNRTAPRVMGVLDPIEVELVGTTPEVIDAPSFPADLNKPGSRALPIGERIYIDRDDWRDDPPAGYQRLAPGRTVRLRYGPCITVEARDGAKLRATVLPETRGGKNPADGRKVSGVIHWVDAATSVTAEVRIYGHLFDTAKPEDGGGDFLEHLDPKSLQVVHGVRLEASLATAAIGARVQLERVGYFIVDEDTRPGAIVLNRIITLHRALALPAQPGRLELTGQPARLEKNAKAATRPKSKSPAEYRAEARVRDADLANAYDQAIALGVTPEQADLLTGDEATAELFAFAAGTGEQPALAAKWIINELPRALADLPRESGIRALLVEDAEPLGRSLNQLFAAILAGNVNSTEGKALLAKMVLDPISLDELRDEVKPVDLSAAIETVIAANPEKASQYKAGKTGLLGFFVGQVMKTTPSADAGAVNRAIRERLG